MEKVFTRLIRHLRSKQLINQSGLWKQLMEGNTIHYSRSITMKAIEEALRDIYGKDF